MLRRLLRLALPAPARPAALDGPVAQALADRVGEIDWATCPDAYERTEDVPAQLIAVIAGDDKARKEAWWDLWGNVHHQGTVYAATVPAVPLLASVASWAEHPDRVEAIHLLRAFADGEGETKPEVDAALASAVPPLVARWPDEPPPVRRALVWLAAAFPGTAGADELVATELPPEHRAAFDLRAAGRDPAGDADHEALDAFETWAR